MANTETHILVEHLTSSNQITVDSAIDEIMIAGGKVIPYLLKLKGNVNFFYGTKHLNPRSSMLLPVPMEGFAIPKSEQDRVITVEAVALYLISAIVHKDIHFARAPLLVDEMQLHSPKSPANTRDRLNRAYSAVLQWVHTYKYDIEENSVDKLPYPLQGSGLSWF